MAWIQRTTQLVYLSKGKIRLHKFPVGTGSHIAAMSPKGQFNVKAL